MRTRWFENFLAKNGLRRRAIAYYRHSAEGRQENSIAIQRKDVRAFAKKHNIEIIREYIDAGKSGLTAEGRPAFMRMMQKVETDHSFDLILIYDHSRWGRFPDRNEAASYQSKCRKHGKQVHYVIHNLSVPEFNERNVANTFIDTAGHGSASDYSEVLSQKVFAGELFIAEKGFRCGGPPPYGMYRLELDDDKNVIGPMIGKARKRFPNGRVRLMKGDPEEVKIVEKIYNLFTDENWTEKQIAEYLNQKGIPSPGGTAWQASTVGNILENEQYAGSAVYNKTASKLTDPITRNPKEEWVVVRNSYEPIIPWDIFEKAQKRFEERRYVPPREELIGQSVRFYENNGMIPVSLLGYYPEAPKPDHLKKRFGSVYEAYQSAFSETIEAAILKVEQLLGETIRKVEKYEDLIVLNDFIVVKIVPSIPFPLGYGYEWFFRIDNRVVVDITLGVALTDVQSPEILGYFCLPRMIMTDEEFYISDLSQSKIDLFGFSDLGFLRDMVRGI